jgi:RimJ/RimL family protein N-acetyltransferase
MNEWVKPVTLAGQFVRLEPLEVRHAVDLFRHVDAELIKYHPKLFWVADSVEELEERIANARVTVTVQFAQCLPSGEAIGVTSYMNIETESRGIEIGGTWLAREFQQTKVNPESKFLLLEHAFDVLGAVRVALKTDERNAQSRAAILKLGASFEGILRKNLIMHDGHLRSTAYYSILDSEWPSVKLRLLDRLLPQIECV